MAEKPAPPKNKKLKLEPRKSLGRTQRSIRIIIICGLIIGLLVSLSWFFRQRANHEVDGTAALTARQLQEISTKEKYTSLDLRIAKLAVYKGAPLQVTRDLGVFGGVHQEEFSFPVYSANLIEYGLMTLPLTPAPPAGYPVVILLHGYITPSRYSTDKAYLFQMEYFSQHGFAVIKPDFRGQGLSKNAGKPEGAYYSMAYNTDVLSLAVSIEDTSYFDKTKINMWGHSMGAYIALRASVLSPDIKNAILLSGPVGTPEDMFTQYVAPSDRANPEAELIRNTELATYGSPTDNPGFWDNTSPLNFLKGNKTFFQIHVGSKDKTVPPRFSAELDEDLKEAGKQHQYFVYPDGDHGLGAQMPQVLQRSLDLISG